LTLDMGGTSADASLIGSDYLLFSGRTTLREGSGAVGGVPLALPALLIETVSAGGGSIASLDDGGALKVGPRSAGAVPGPACYGRGGTEPTVTDACLALGWLDADCPLADSLRLDKAAALRALATLGRGGDPVSTAAGVVEVATAIMARALKRVSVARGIDPRSLALLPFGGAGPLFGCALAESLGMSKVIVPPHPGVLSALGLAVSPERVDVLASFHVRFEDLDREMVARAFEPLVAAAWKELQTMDDAEGGTVSRYVDCRFVGQGHEITVRMMWDDTDLLERMFREMHRERHGHSDPDSAVEVVNLRVVAERYSTEIVPWGRRPTAIPVEPVQRSIVGRDGKRVDAGVYPLDQMPDGQQIDGPAVLAGPDATGLIEAGWRGVVSPSGAVIVERA
jgi:N-methylhydantoinase A